MKADLARYYGEERLPRYTSYPTAPHFSPAISHDVYRNWLGSIGSDETVSLYLHIPFCRSMCWYCGCHTTVAKRDEPVGLYLAALRREISLVAETIQHKARVSRIHFGGGTPTIMSPEQFAELVGSLRDCFSVCPNAEIAVEIDPRTLTEAMTLAMGDCGVTRASLGVQSFDPAVQRAINRAQSVEQTSQAMRWLRDAGIGGINFDLIYGLPLQTTETCLETAARCVELRPDRLSVFGYAHVPSFKKHQRKIPPDALPNSLERHLQSEAIANSLQAAGYVRIGMDHFALPDDGIAVARRDGHLRRNFQGYTDDASGALIGLGSSAISKLPQGYVQNAVVIRDYLARITNGHLATVKGYALTEDDRFRADIVERIMCDLSVDLRLLCRHHSTQVDDAIINHDRIARLVADGAVTMRDGQLRIGEGFEFLVRSVASAFDTHLTTSPAVHSRAV